MRRADPTSPRRPRRGAILVGLALAAAGAAPAASAPAQIGPLVTHPGRGQVTSAALAPGGRAVIGVIRGSTALVRERRSLRARLGDPVLLGPVLPGTAVRVAVNRRGDALAVWVARMPAGKRRVLVARRSGPTGRWTRAQATGLNTLAAIAITRNGRARVVAAPACAAGTCSVTVAEAAAGGRFVRIPAGVVPDVRGLSVAAGGPGDVLVTGTSTSGQALAAHLPAAAGAGWEAPQVLSPAGEKVRVVVATVGRAGDLAASWNSADPADAEAQRAFVAVRPRTAAAFGAPIALPIPAGVRVSPARLALDQAGDVLATWVTDSPNEGEAGRFRSFAAIARAGSAGLDAPRRIVEIDFDGNPPPDAEPAFAGGTAVVFWTDNATGPNQAGALVRRVRAGGTWTDSGFATENGVLPGAVALADDGTWLAADGDPGFSFIDSRGIKLRDFAPGAARRA